jgi:tRNA threonylcarbamoyladenosine biosynthesis protein TsaE
MSDLLKKLRTGLITKDAAETEQIASDLASHLPPDTVLALHGDLGSGKTTFVRGLARGLEIREPITSPTFNLYSIYQGSRQLIHLDAYRLESGTDLDALMIEDFLRPPWCFAVEWPERIHNALPDDTWHLYLEINAKSKHHIQLKQSAFS